MGFVIIDKSGNLKANMGGSFPDPVTVPHGGHGLTDVAVGDLFYGSAANTVSRLARDSGGTRALSNQGTSNNPAWSDPATLALTGVIPASRQFAATAWPRNSTTAQDICWTSSATDAAAGAFLADTTDTWRRFTTAASTASVSGLRASASVNWLDHNPKFKCKIRTGSAVTSTRLWFIISSATAVLSNSDDQHALKGVGLRFSTAAGDAGFVPWTADGTTQTIGSSILAVAANTVYTITISVSGSVISYDINGTTGTASLPSGALGAAMRWNVEVMALSNNARVLDVGALYGEWD